MEKPGDRRDEISTSPSGYDNYRKDEIDFCFSLYERTEEKNLRENRRFSRRSRREKGDNRRRQCKNELIGRLLRRRGRRKPSQYRHGAK